MTDQGSVDASTPVTGQSRMDAARGVLSQRTMLQSLNPSLKPVKCLNKFTFLGKGH